MNRRMLVASIAALALLPACATMKENERSRKLTVLAAQEAGNIADADSRLTLQLNIANGALARFEPEDAMAIISEVAKTLRAERENLRGRTRLSGWVSASQLSRRAKNTAAAAEATRAAAQELEDLPDQVERCQYLLGVAEEVRLSQGDGAAVALLSRGGEWADAIDDRAERRQARLAFADALLEVSAYEHAVLVLRREKDATWSSSTLLALAGTPLRSAFAYERGVRETSMGNVAFAPVDSPRPDIARALPAAESSDSNDRPPAPKRARHGFGKAVDFSSVFENRSSSAQ